LGSGTFEPGTLPPPYFHAAFFIGIWARRRPPVSGLALRPAAQPLRPAPKADRAHATKSWCEDARCFTESRRRRHRSGAGWGRRSAGGVLPVGVAVEHDGGAAEHLVRGGDQHEFAVGLEPAQDVADARADGQAADREAEEVPDRVGHL
jgi:hypothetical protein